MNTQPKTATRVPGPSSDFEMARPDPAAIARTTLNAPAAQAVDVDIPAAMIPQTSIANIAKAISAVMSEIGIIGKDGRNEFHKYQYAKMEDILQRLTPLMAKNGLVVFQTELDRSMFDDERAVAVRYAFTICHSSGEVWPERPIQTGVSRCRDSKNNFDDKALNKAHTAARKYFLLALFQIPTGAEDDADRGTNDGHTAPSRKPPVPSPNASGRRPPHVIASQGESFQSWAQKFMAEVSGAINPIEIDDWVRLNLASLGKLQRGAPPALDRLWATLNPHFQRAFMALTQPNPTPERDSPADDRVIWDETEERPATAADHDPATGEVVPDADTSPDNFYGFMESKFRQAETVTDIDDAWEQYVTPRIKDIFPTDRTALEQARDYRKKKLEGKQ